MRTITSATACAADTDDDEDSDDGVPEQMRRAVRLDRKHVPLVERDPFGGTRREHTGHALWLDDGADRAHDGRHGVRLRGTALDESRDGIETIGEVEVVAEPKRAFERAQGKRRQEVRAETKGARKFRNGRLRYEAERRGRNAGNQGGHETLRAVLERQFPEHAGHARSQRPLRSRRNELQADAERLQRRELRDGLIAAMKNGKRECVVRRSHLLRGHPPRRSFRHGVDAGGES